MRKANKIVMSAVAILLCLVLISTSVVSGVFAKFVINQSTKAQVTFGKFGVNVTITPSNGVKAYQTSDVEQGMSATMAFDDIPLYPGAEFKDALTIKFEGTPNVKVKVSVIFHVNYLDSGKTSVTKIIAGTGLVTQDTVFMPLGFTFGANYVDKDAEQRTTVLSNSYVLPPLYASTSTNSGNIRTATEQAIRDAVSGTMSVDTGEFSSNKNSQGSGTDHGLYLIFDPNETDDDGNKTEAANDIADNGIHFHPKGTSDDNRLINEFVIGFGWPKTWPPEGQTNTLNYDYDAIGTYLAANTDGKPIKIWYTVKLEQVR